MESDRSPETANEIAATSPMMIRSMVIRPMQRMGQQRRRACGGPCRRVRATLLCDGGTESHVEAGGRQMDESNDGRTESHVEAGGGRARGSAGGSGACGWPLLGDVGDAVEEDAEHEQGHEA